MKIILVFFSIALVILSNAQITNLQGCKAIPSFIQKKGFAVKRTVFSTSEKKYPGLVMFQIADTNTKNAKTIYYQDESWKKYGSMGTFSFDEKGNIYLIPIPWVNVLKNEKKNQNTVYKVDAITGVMTPLIQLPSIDKYDSENAFGLLGLSYDCTTKYLYVSTVSASSRLAEKGVIYVIDTRNKKASLVDSLVGKDALGLGITRIGNNKILLIGSARNSGISYIKIDSLGKFLNKKTEVLFSLDNIGSRGDDKAKKFDFANNLITIKGVEFDWNLIAPTEQQQAIYTFQYNVRNARFELIDLQSNDGLQRY